MGTEVAVPPELREAFEDGNLIVCVGPQLAVEAGLPSLATLAAMLLDYARHEGVEPDAAIADWIEGGRVAAALGELQRELGAEFGRIVENALDDRGRVVPPLAEAIAGLQDKLRAIYTTNLDRIIERALGSRPWPSFGMARADLSQRRRLVFKLRGELQRRTTWVLTGEQEEREFLSPQAKRRMVFETAYRAHRLLLVGFEPDDPTLARLLDMMPMQAGDETPSHFIILDASGRAARRELARRGLRLIQADATELLAELGHAERREKTLAGDGPDVDCPYPGLEAFSEELAEVFFGRHAEVSEATSRLGDVGDEHRRWLSVEGPSGVGKSSFVHAGIVPALRNGFATGTPSSWLVARMRPGAHPLHALAESVNAALGLPGEAAELEHKLRDSVGTLSNFLRRVTPPGHALLLVVDQLEELVTFAAEDEREPFAAALARALDAERIYLITTLRSDFVPQLQAGVRGLAERLNDQAERYAVPAITRVGLRDAITQPAARLGVTIDPELVEQILVDASGPARRAEVESRAGASVLPLVAHVLRGLWDAGAADDKLIELGEYFEVGGVMGALSRSADGILDELGEAERLAAKQLFLGLVRVDASGESRRTVPRAEAVELAGGGLVGENLLARLSGGAAADGDRPAVRLVVVREDSEGPRVDLVHEALLRDWGTFRVWIDQNRRQMLLDEELDRRASRWLDKGRPRDDLPSGADLDDLLRGRPHGPRFGLHTQFHDALLTAKRRRRLASKWRRIAWSLTLGAALIAAGTVNWVLRAQHAKNERLERETELSERLELGRQASELALVEGRELDALERGVQAVGRYDLGTELPPLVTTRGLLDASNSVRAIRVFRAHEAAIAAIAYSPEGDVLATAGKDGVLGLWDATTAAAKATPSGHGDELTALAFAPDGASVATASRDYSVRIWSVETGEEQYALEDLAKPPVGLVFGATGQLAIRSEWDAGVRLWTPGHGDQRVLGGLEADVTAIAFAPDGKRLAASADDGTTLIWTVESEPEPEPEPEPESAPASESEPEPGPRRLTGSDARLGGLAWSADGSLLATAGDDNLARVWSPETGEAIATLAGHQAELSALAFRPRGSLLATVSRDHTARLWEADSGVVRATLEGHRAELVALAWSADGSLLATVGADERVRTWSVDSGRELDTFRSPGAQPIGLAFAPDGATLATAHADGSTQLWSTRAGHLVTKLDGHGGAALDAVFSPDGERLATASEDARARLWSTRLGQLVEVLDGHQDRVSAVVFSPDGELLATTGEDRELRLWDADSGELRHALTDHAGAVRVVVFSPDATLVASVSEFEFDARLWSTSSGELATALSGHRNEINALAFAPDGETLATASTDDSARLWDLDGRALAELSHGAAVTSVAFSPDGGRLVSAARDGSLRIRAANTGTQTEVEGSGSAIVELGFSADGATLVSLDETGTLALREAGSGESRARLVDLWAPIAGFTLDPTGAVVASVSRYAPYVRLWSVESGELLAELGGHHGSITDVAFSPDGATLASASTDHTVRTWDVASGEFVDLLQGHDDRVLSVAWSPDGQALASASADKSARLWTRGVVGWLADACETLIANRAQLERGTQSICGVSGGAGAWPLPE